MTPITAETACERTTIMCLPRGWQSMSNDELGKLLASLEQGGEWPLVELVELELEQREGSQS